MPKKLLSDASNSVLRQTDLKTVKLGSKPFSTSIKYFVAFQEISLAKTTIYEDERKLRLFAKFFEGLYESGGCSTMDPRRFDEPIISEFLVWMKNRNLKASTQANYVKVLNRLLMLFGNDVILRMRKNPIYKFPKEPRDTPIDALCAEELQLVLDTTYNLRGWSGQAFRGALTLAFATAARPKEVLGALGEDLDLSKMAFYIRHPKGEGNWGNPQWIPILRVDMLHYILDFLDDRDKMLMEYGIQSDYLFVNPGTGLPYTEKSMRGLKGKVEDMCGISFMVKEMRSTFASLTVNNCPERLNAVSEQLRHASPETTRRYYARLDRQKAIKRSLGDTWKETRIN